MFDKNNYASGSLLFYAIEDRVMKMSFVDIGKDCSVGGMAVVLYDSKMEDKFVFEPLSVLMKSETLPANTYFVGVTAKNDLIKKPWKISSKVFYSLLAD